MSIPSVRVAVTLDKPRTLVIDFNALCRVEEVTGQSMLVGAPAFSSMIVLRALTWAGLLHEDPTLTLEAVGAMLGDADSGEMLDSIMEAYNAAMPEQDDDDEEDDSEESDPLKPQPGEVFGQSGDTTFV